MKGPLGAPTRAPIGPAFLVLGLAALAAAMWFGWLATTRIEYFPPSYLEVRGVFGAVKNNDPIVSDIQASWYSATWRAADEPSLYQSAKALSAGSQADSLRFTWLTGFHPSVIVRLDRLSDGGQQMTATQLAESGPQRIVRRLTASEQEQLAGLLTETKILSLPAVEGQGYPDAGSWILERASTNGYTYIHRWTPEQNSPMRGVGLFHALTDGMAAGSRPVLGPSSSWPPKSPAPHPPERCCY